MLERAHLVHRLHQHLERRGRPRLELFLLVALSGLVGFLVSFGLLGAGVVSMPLRYGIAGAAAYLAFLCLLAVYIRRKGRLDGARDGLDALDAVSVMDPQFAGGADQVAAFAGGRSGGGGAAASWDGAAVEGSGGRSWMDADLDVGWILIAVAAAVGGLLAVGYVVWTAPALLAEVLVDALIVSTVSRQVGRVERRDWTATALRRTWLPATLTIATLVVAGWALQHAAPDAKSIGPALRTLAAR